jgi:uncharacterized membrane protein
VSQRLQSLDAARGLAIVAMVVFHLVWDLGNFGYIDNAIPYSAGVRLFGHAIAIAFLMIVGVSLVLAQGKGLAHFGRRFALIAGAAGLVSLGTYLMFPQSFVFFGILHCIALASLLAQPFLKLRSLAALAVALAAILAPEFLRHAVFDAPLLSWIGLSTREPPTNDYRPLLPWGGYVFLGVAAAQFWRECGLAPIGAGWKVPPLAFMGRHSLAIYLAHQPALFGIFYGLTTLGVAPPDPGTKAFLDACEQRCLQSDLTPEVCRPMCACTASRLAGLTPTEAADPEARARRLGEIALGCLRGAK